jgi:four helix bundle protein
MDKNDLIKRIKIFVINVLRLCEKLPKSEIYYVFRNQLLRCASSVGANHRAACRAKSTADFINKLKIVEEEADESIYFLELLKEFETKNTSEIERLLLEANELLSIFVASIKTARNNQLTN